MSYFCQKRKKLGGYRLCFGGNISEWPSQMSVCLKILQMNLKNRIFYAKFYMSGSIKQIKTTGNVSLSKFNL